MSTVLPLPHLVCLFVCLSKQANLFCLSACLFACLAARNLSYYRALIFVLTFCPYDAFSPLLVVIICVACPSIIRSSVCLFVYLFVCLSVCLFVCLVVCLLACLLGCLLDSSLPCFLDSLLPRLLLASLLAWDVHDGKNNSQMLLQEIQKNIAALRVLLYHHHYHYNMFLLLNTQLQ